MNGIYAAIIAFGFIPFIITMFKMKKMKRLRATGIKTKAIVREVYGRSPNGMNRVLIEYDVRGSHEPYKKNIIVAGTPYSPGDELPLVHAENKPGNPMVDSGKGYIFLIIFTLIIAIGMIAACYMIDRSIAAGEL